MQSADSNGQRTSIAPLVGGSVGGLVSLIIILLTVVVLLKRRRKQRYNREKFGQAPEDPRPATIIDTKGLSYFPNSKAARAAQESPIDIDMPSSPDSDMAHPIELPRDRTSSERETSVNQNRESGTRPQNLTPADLLQILVQPRGNLVALLSQHVRPTENQNDNEPLPGYVSEFGSR
jgi:hypothetical protein